MNRRDTLRRCAALGAAGATGFLAGCSGGGEGGGTRTTTATASLSIEKIDYGENDEGKLVVDVTVKNSGEAKGTGHLYVTVIVAEKTTGNGTASGEGTRTDADGDDTVAARESLEVTVPAGESKTVSIPFEFTLEQYLRNGSIKPELRT